MPILPFPPPSIAEMALGEPDGYVNLHCRNTLVVEPKVVRPFKAISVQDYEGGFHIKAAKEANNG